MLRTHLPHLLMVADFLTRLWVWGTKHKIFSPFTKCAKMSPFTRPQLDSKLQIPQMPPSFTLQALGFSTRSVLLKPSFQNSATADGCSYFQKLEVYLGLAMASLVSSYSPGRFQIHLNWHKRHLDNLEYSKPNDKKLQGMTSIAMTTTNTLRWQGPSNASTAETLSATSLSHHWWSWWPSTAPVVVSPQC